MTVLPFDRTVRLRLREADAVAPTTQDLALLDGNIVIRRGDLAASEAPVGAPVAPAVGGAADAGRVVGLDATGQLDRLTYARVVGEVTLVSNTHVPIIPMMIGELRATLLALAEGYAF